MLSRFKYQSTPNLSGVSSHLNIDIVTPDFLFLAGTVSANCQDFLHLLCSHQHLLTSNKPSHSLGTRRRSETSLIGPEILRALDLGKGLFEIEIERDASGHVGEGGDGW